MVAAPQQQLYLHVGRRVRVLRENLGWTQDDLARRVGLGRTSITNLERGRQQPPLYQLLSIAVALNVELHDLLPRRSELGAVEAGVPVIFGDGATVPASTKQFIERALAADDSPNEDSKQ